MRDPQPNPLNALSFNDACVALNDVLSEALPQLFDELHAPGDASARAGVLRAAVEVFQVLAIVTEMITLVHTPESSAPVINYNTTVRVLGAVAEAATARAEGRSRRRVGNDVEGAAGDALDAVAGGGELDDEARADRYRRVRELLVDVGTDAVDDILRRVELSYRAPAQPREAAVWDEVRPSHPTKLAQVREASWAERVLAGELRGGEALETPATVTGHRGGRVYNGLFSRAKRWLDGERAIRCLRELAMVAGVGAFVLAVVSFVWDTVQDGDNVTLVEQLVGPLAPPDEVLEVPCGVYLYGALASWGASMLLQRRRKAKARVEEHRPASDAIEPDEAQR